VSHYNNFNTQITDPKALARALCRCKSRNGYTFTEAMIENHEIAVSLKGYQNDIRQQTANVIIRRNHVGGSSNDIGFAKQGDGTYQAIISDFDSSYYSKQWLGHLQMHYNIEKTKISLDEKGIKYVETKDEKGRIQLRAKFQDVGGSRIQVKAR
jgi:glutaredoxin